MTTEQILVIDPAMKTAETECYNAISLMSPLKTTYHLPAIYGLQSLGAIDMNSVRGIVILGSASSVNDRLPWQAALETWLMPHLQRGIPTLGICYGHQMLAFMFGGTVDYVFPDQTKFKGMRPVNFAGLPWMDAVRGDVVVSHNEMVKIVPPVCRVIATSADCATDGLAHNTLPVWSFQSHPEATREFLINHDIDTEKYEKQLVFGRELVLKFLRYAASTR